MKHTIALAALMAVAATPLAATAAQAQDYRWNGDRNSDWDPSRHYGYDNHRRELADNDHVYRGSDGRYYCKKSNGRTGLVLGAVGGGLIGNALGGGLLGTVLGAGGGALLGKSLDKKNDTAQDRRKGYYCD
jgi:Ni/Co efflux regulator RcnB